MFNIRAIIRSFGCLSLIIITCVAIPWMEANASESKDVTVVNPETQPIRVTVIDLSNEEGSGSCGICKEGKLFQVYSYVEPTGPGMVEFSVNIDPQVPILIKRIIVSTSSASDAGFKNTSLYIDVFPDIINGDKVTLDPPLSANAGIAIPATVQRNFSTPSVLSEQSIYEPELIFSQNFTIRLFPTGDNFYITLGRTIIEIQGCLLPPRS